jgi:hypothetical protein
MRETSKIPGRIACHETIQQGNYYTTHNCISDNLTFIKLNNLYFANLLGNLQANRFQTSILEFNTASAIRLGICTLFCPYNYGKMTSLSYNKYPTFHTDVSAPSVVPKINVSCVLAQFLSQQKYQCETVYITLFINLPNIM